MFRIVHLYPSLLNLYGDQGNLTVLKKRLEWRGCSAAVESVNLRDEVNWDDVDMIFMGGGSDREQHLVLEDLRRHTDVLLEKIEAGLPALLVCGAYQLAGKSYRHGDYALEGLGWFDFETIGGKKRLVGNVLIECEFGGMLENVIGFENHAGQTYFAPGSGLKAWGRVIKGYGNNEVEGWEGLRYKNLIGTYLHGPILPKNPLVADSFIQEMFRRKGMDFPAEAIDDRLAHYAHQQIYHKLMS
jgi:CobQ-like glutamine amidotransferase family enzyme